MDDHEKLAAIEKICKQAFNDPDTRSIDLYRAQALANVYGVLLYNGANIINTHEAVNDYLDNRQLTIDEFLSKGLPTSDHLQEWVDDYYREPVTIGQVARLKHAIDVARSTDLEKHIPLVIKMSKTDCYDFMGLLYTEMSETLEFEDNGHHSFMGVPIVFTKEHGIRLCAETKII